MVFSFGKNVNNIWVGGSEDYTIPQNAKEQRKKRIKFIWS